METTANPTCQALPETAGLRAGDVRLWFESMPNTLFFTKDLEGRITTANREFAERCGMRSEAEVVGLTDADIFPLSLAERYLEGDRKVIATGRPVLGIIELFPNPAGVPDWCETNKLPLVDADGRVCGVWGAIRSYQGARAALQPYLELARAEEHLKKNHAGRLDVGHLAKLAGMSVRQFERRFKRTFKMTPRTYQMKMRVAVAAELLRTTERPATEIALEVGFYDHSDFSRQFRRILGVPPTEYRGRKRGENPAVCRKNTQTPAI